MSRNITFKGEKMTLVGRLIRIGRPAPDFKVTSQDMMDVSLSGYSAKIKVITTFLSLDTPVCDLQVKEFNKRSSQLSPEVTILGVSKDLPFAQKRFCSANDIKNVVVLSDYKYSSFGINYGLLIKEMNLLARATLILDKNNVLRYVDIVEEATNPPDYEKALGALKEVIDNPAKTIKETGLRAKCVP